MYDVTEVTCKKTTETRVIAFLLRVIEFAAGINGNGRMVYVNKNDAKET